VRQEAVGDEVVRALDVQVVDRTVERRPGDALDDVVAAALVDHHHSGSDRRGRHERKRVARLGAGLLRHAKARGVPDGNRKHVLDLADRALNPGEVGAAGLESPSGRPAIRRPQRDARLLERVPTLVVIPEERDPVHRTAAPSVAAECDREPPPRPVSSGRRRGTEVRKVEEEPFVLEQELPARLGVELGEDAVERLLVADDAGGRCVRARDERERRHRVAQGENRLRDARFGVALVRGKHPGRIRVFLVHAEGRPRNGSCGGTARVRARDTDPEAHPALPHQVRHVQLRCPSDLEAREVHVLRSRDEPTS
jgi:hypothetical protein